MDNKDDNKKKKIDVIIKIILIIIIIILLIHNCVLNKREDDKKVPTGNVDIIEITCDKEDVCKVDPNKKDNKGTNKNGDSKADDKQGSETSEEEVIEDAGILIVEDEDIVWYKDAEVKIFTNSMYELKDVIAPESSNTYQFIVKNGTDFNLKYSINFSEVNPYGIIMKYKLKKNDTYIIDHYVLPSELHIENYLLNATEGDTYYLEWKWFSGDNDTMAGKNPNNAYKLKIEVKAEGSNG